MTDFDPSDFTSVDPKKFAQIVKSTPDAQLGEVMQGEMRGKILNEVFGRMPSTFRPDRAGNWTFARPGAALVECVHGLARVEGKPRRSPGAAEGSAPDARA